MRVSYSVRPRHSQIFASLLALYQITSLPCPAAQQTPSNTPATETKSPTIPSSEEIRLATVRRLWSKYLRLGIAAMKKNDLNTALSMLSQAVQEAEVLKLDNAEFAECLDLLSVVYQRMGRSKDSLLCEQKALDIIKRSGGDNDETKIAMLKKIGDICNKSDDQDNAKKYLQQAYTLAQTAKLDEATKYSIADSLAGLAIDSGDLANARKYLSTLHELDKKRTPDQDTARHLELQGRLQWRDAQLNEAAQSLAQALEIRKKCEKPDEAELTALLRNLIKANLIVGNMDQPQQDIHKVLTYDRSHLAPNSADYLFDLLSLAELKIRAGELNAARQLCDEVLKCQKESQQSPNLDSAECYSILARVCAAENQWHEAKNLAEQSLAIKNKLGLPPALAVNERETLARCALAQGLKEEAITSFKQALSIRQEKLANDQTSIARINGQVKAIKDTAKSHSDTIKLSGQEHASLQ